MTALSVLFNVEYGNKFDMNKMERAEKGTGIAFVGRRGGLTGSSGVSGYVARNHYSGAWWFPLTFFVRSATHVLHSSERRRPYAGRRFYAVEAQALLRHVYQAQRLPLHGLRPGSEQNTWNYPGTGRSARLGRRHGDPNACGAGQGNLGACAAAPADKGIMVGFSSPRLIRGQEG
jgi:hypothetical protein